MRFLLLFLIPFALQAQKPVSPKTGNSSPRIQSGPMLGYSDHREVLLWVQTNKEADVCFRLNIRELLFYIKFF